MHAGDGAAKRCGQRLTAAVGAGGGADLLHG